ncbi:MAG: isopentenyl transferase family protein, partial [Acidobacteriota bacterium]
MSSEKKRLLVLLGPTAVGKSGAAVRIAKAVGAEIINCDSMQ